MNFVMGRTAIPNSYPMTTANGSFGQLKSDVRKAAKLLAFAASLPRFLHEQVTLDQAAGEIKKALDTRENRFLELICAEVFNRSDSPYLKLLNHAGCTFADLRTHVQRYGVE